MATRDRLLELAAAAEENARLMEQQYPLDAEEAAERARSRLMETGRAAVEALRREAATYRKLAERTSLPRIPVKGTLGVPKMEASSASRGAKVSMARTSKPTLFQEALHRRNLSLPEWARKPAQQKRGLTVEAAKSWVKRPSHGGRPIPLVWAERIASDFWDESVGASEVPPVDDSWPNGIR